MVLSFGHLHCVPKFGFVLDRAAEEVKMFGLFGNECRAIFAEDRCCGIGVDQNIEHLFLAIFVRHNESVFGICYNLLGGAGEGIVGGYDAGVFVIGVWGDEGALFLLECVFG